MRLSRPFQIISTSLEPLKDDVIRSFRKQKQSAVLIIQFLDDNAHSLPCARELQDIKQLIPLGFFRERCLQKQFLLLTSAKDKPSIRSGLDEGSFIR